MHFVAKPLIPVGHLEESFHALKDVLEVDHVLSGVLDHILTQWPGGMPESRIFLHCISDFLFLIVLNFITEVPRQELVEADLVLILATRAYVLCRFDNHSVCDLSVKNV